MDPMSFISENFLILIPVIIFIGFMLKKSKVPDWVIPYVLTAAGVGFAIWIQGVNPDAVIQGILVASAAVMGNQVYKQTMTKSGMNSGKGII